MTQEKFYNQLSQSLPSLRQLALRYTGITEDAEDLLQDTLIMIIERKDKYENINFIGWGCTLLTHLYFNKRRHKKIIFFYDEIPSDAIIENSFNFGLQEIELLPQPFRETIKLLIEGYNYKEIALKLHISIGTVKSRISRTRKLLYKVLIE